MPLPWKKASASLGKGRRINGFENRAITLKQLRDLSFLLQRLCKAHLLRRTTEHSRHCGTHGAPICWFDINMYDICDELIKKLIPHLDPDCPPHPETRQPWYSWVELVADGPQAPTLFFSHWWGGLFRDFVHMAEAAVQEKQLSIHTGIWVCTFALNQFGEDFGSSLAECPFVRGFGAATSVALIVDRLAGSLRRTWCAFELQLTTEGRKCLDLYTPTGRVGSESASSGPLVDAVAAWDIRRTEATEECDRRQILNRVAGVPEFAGILQSDGHPVLTKDGRRVLDDRALAEGSGPSRRLGGQPEWAHEAGLFERHGELFDALNASVRAAVMSSIDGGSAAEGCVVHDHAMRGISLGQLRAFARKVRQQCELGWPGARAVPGAVTTWETLTTDNVAHWMLRPLAERAGCSYLEHCGGLPQPPRIYVSHSWKSRFMDTMAAVDWFAEARRLTDSTPVFVDLLCVVQTEETPPDEIFKACMHQASELLLCCGRDVSVMRMAWLYYEFLQFTTSGKCVTFGCHSGSLSSGMPFHDGGQEFGMMDVEIARILCSLRIADPSTFYLPDPSELEFVKAAIAASFEDLSRADAFARFEGRLHRLAAGPALRAAAAKDDAAAIRRMCGCPGLQLSSATLTGSLGEAALHVAAAGGRLDALRALLELRAPPNVQDCHGETPLHYAAMAGQAEAVRTLLAAGADGACESFFGETPLEVARHALAGFLGVSTASAAEVLATRGATRGRGPGTGQ